MTAPPPSKGWEGRKVWFSMFLMKSRGDQRTRKLLEGKNTFQIIPIYVKLQQNPLRLCL